MFVADDDRVRKMVKGARPVAKALRWTEVRIDVRLGY
jgi:hypothetical protein